MNTPIETADVQNIKEWTGDKQIVAKAFSPELYHQVTQFLFLEARLQDNNEYDAWESLWTDDGVYWLPANGANTDPEREMSIIYDNRSRIGLRIRQFKTDRRFTQTPASQLSRILGNIELQEDDGSEITVACNSIIFETNIGGDVVWGARCTYRLRRIDNGFKLAFKKVILTNNNKAINTISFLV